MDVDDNGNVEVLLKEEDTVSDGNGVNSDTDHADAKVSDLKYQENKGLENKNSLRSLTPRSFRKNKPKKHDGGIFSQDIWIHESDSDTSPSFIDSSSTSSKSEEGRGLDNKSTTSSGSLSAFIENHAHLLPLALQKRQSSSRTIKTGGSKKTSFAADDYAESETKLSALSGDSSFSSLQLLNLQETLKSVQGGAGSVLNVLGYDSDDEDLDKILGPAKRSKEPKQSKTLSSWNANIATAIAAKKSERSLPLPPTPEEPREDQSLKDFPRFKATFSEDSYSRCNIEQMDYSTVSESSRDGESDLVYEHGESNGDSLEKYRMSEKSRCFRRALRVVLCIMIVAIFAAATAAVLIALPYLQENEEVAQGDTQDVDSWTDILPDSTSQQPSPNPTFGSHSSTSSAPTILPTQRPSKQPTETPTTTPSVHLSETPSKRTSNPTRVPSRTQTPTSSPTRRPTQNPTTERPTSSPTKRPTQNPTTVDHLVTNFYVIGDLPYNNQERDRLIHHVNHLPPDAEFLVHVGDIRDGESKEDCERSEFQDVANILKQSPVPVFIVPGDNEYNDCPNLDESWEDYLAEFGNFEQHFETQLRVSRDPLRKENFFFVHKRVLYIGLNVVGGWRHDYAEWERRLELGWIWTRNLIETYVRSAPFDASSIVIFAHADPRPSAHGPFFEPLKQYIREELKNEVPIFYVNGDMHYWQFDPNFYGEPSFHRLMVEGGSKEPALKMTMIMPNNPQPGPLEVYDVYSFDRRL